MEKMHKRYRNEGYNKGGRKRIKYEDIENDVGIVHYRESSNSLHSPPGYDQKKTQKQIIVEKITLGEGSLFNMCLKFLSVNIDLLDSLVGLPEIIGEQLLSYMIHNNVFNFQSTGYLSPFDRLKIKKLALFDEAYNELLLRSLSLTNIHENFDFMPLLHCFQNLVELDLSGRTLSDDIFSLLSKFSCLEKVILQNTGLNDKSVIKLTLPYRMYKDNPQEIEILDISNNNDITNESIELLLTFTKLKTLNLTGTSVSMNYLLVYELKQFGWQISRDEPTYSKPKTIGWAEPIISQLGGEKLKTPNCSKAAKFYSTKKKKTVVMSVRKENLILFRNWFPNHSLKFNRAVLVDSGQTKSLHIGQNIKANNQSLHKKRSPEKDVVVVKGFFVKEDEEENQDIFQQYIGYTLPSRKTQCLGNI